MRVFRNYTTALMLAMISSLAILGSGCEYARKVIAKDKVNQGAIKYNQGNTKEAQEFFKDATETDPTYPITWLYYGATLVKDYKVELDDARKKEIATKALEVYNKALSLANGNCVIIDNALSYIASIHDDMSNFEEWRKTMEDRATNACTKKEGKSQSFYAISVKYWQCSYDQTTRYQDKILGIKDPFHYRNMDYPAALEDKRRAEACVTRGLENIEKAMQIDPEYVDAMAYKSLLYYERLKMTKDESMRKKLEQDAVRISNEGIAMQKRREAAAAQQREQEQAAPRS